MRGGAGPSSLQPAADALGTPSRRSLGATGGSTLASSHEPSGHDEINPAPAPSEEEVAASPRGWLRRNGPILFVVLALFLSLHFYFEMEFDTWRRILITALGLGFVIFVHELGHFLVA